MKHIHADKIMQFAKMVEAGHLSTELVQFKVPNGEWYRAPYPEWTAEQYRVAIAFVEGKPVFRGDRLYVYGIPIRADRVVNKIDLKHLSWKAPKAPELNPPKPLTFADAVTAIRQGFRGKIAFTDGEYDWIITSVRRDLYTD